MTDDLAPASRGKADPDVRIPAKRPWHTPKVEEVDYTAAEGGTTARPNTDLTTYDSIF